MTLKHLLYGVCALVLSADFVSAQDLRFEFTIDSQISGARDWDYSGLSSSALDNIDTGIGSALLGDGLLGNAADAVIGTGIDVTVDQLETRFAPPDPYLCIVAINGQLPATLGEAQARYLERDFTASCTPRSEIKTDRLQFNLDLPDNIARHEIFGVLLVDSDAEQFLQDGGRFEDRDDGDEVIGFGLYINQTLYDLVQQSDQSSLRLVRHYEERLPNVVRRMFRFNQSALLDLDKLSLQRCRSSCRFGHASLTIKDTVGGW